MAGGGSFAVGYAVLAGVLGACTGVAHLVVRARFAGLRGAARAVALFVVFEAALLVVHLLPAALGGLSRGAVLLVAAAALAVAFAIPRTPAVAGPERPEPPSPRWSWALAIGAWCLVLAYLAVYLQGHHANAVHHVDLLTFHLPDMARWMQDGTIWQNDQFVPLFANGNYPQHGDVSFLAVTLPFSQDSLVRLVPYPYLLATGVAVFAVARELRAPASTAALAAAALVATPVVLRPAVVASLPDAVLLMTFAAGTLFLLRHARNGRRGELVLAGVALGIALGTKWYGVSTVAIAVVVWLAARVLAGHRHRAIARDGLLVTALVAAAGGIWLVRNWAVTGNPLFPVKVPGLFDAPPDVIRERFGFSVADYLGDPAAWREHLLPDWWTAFSLAGLALLPGVLAARGRGLALAAAVPAIVLAYVITPYTALGERGDPLLIAQNARYVVPALLLAAPLTAAAVGRLRGARPLAEGALAGAVVLALLSVERVPASRFAAATLAFAALAGLWLVRDRLPRLPQLPAPAWRGAVAAAAVLLAGFAATHELRQRQAPGRYAALEPTLSWLSAATPPGTRVGLAGQWDASGTSPVYPAFGRRLENHVAYVGPFRRGMLERHDSAKAFLAQLRRDRYDVLVVGRHGRPREARWAARAGWTVALRDRRLQVMLPPGSALARSARAAARPAAPAPPRG